MHTRVPKYRNHKASGQAIVEINGRHFYLGKYDSPESHEKYRQKITAYLAQQEPDDTPLPSLRVDRLILKYFSFAKSCYVRNGKQTEEIVTLRIALKRLRKLYGSTEAAKFGPKAFKTFRDSMIQEGLSRKYINDTTGRIKRMFKWAVAEELIPPAVFQALTATGRSWCYLGTHSERGSGLRVRCWGQSGSRRSPFTMGDTHLSATLSLVVGHWRKSETQQGTRM